MIIAILSDKTANKFRALLKWAFPLRVSTVFRLRANGVQRESVERFHWRAFEPLRRVCARFFLSFLSTN